MAVAAALTVAAVSSRAQAPSVYALHEVPEGATLHKVSADPAEYKGRKALKVEFTEAANKERPGGGGDMPTFVLIPTNFKNGTIEVDLLGRLNGKGLPDARAFVGLAYRETVGKPAEKVQGRFVRQTGGSGQYGDAVINLLPVESLAGRTLFRWHRGAWAATFLAAVFLLLEVLLVPAARSQRYTKAPFLVTASLFVLFAAVSVGFNRYFAHRHRTAMTRAAPPDPPLAPVETAPAVSVVVPHPPVAPSAAAPPRHPASPDDYDGA